MFSFEAERKMLTEIETKDAREAKVEGSVADSPMKGLKLIFLPRGREETG